MQRLGLDFVRALRVTARRPHIAIVTAIVIAGGIGAAAAILTVVEATVVRPLPLRDSDRVVWMWNARTERDRAPFSYADLRDYREQNHVLDDLAAFTNWSANLSLADEAVRLEGVRVTANFFDVLGAAPAVGRTFVAGEDRGAGANVAVISHGLWQREFGADPAIFSRTVLLNGTRYAVIGVLPPSFTFPYRNAQIAVPLPLDVDPRRVDRGANFLRVVARMKRGVSVVEGKADLDRIADGLRRQYPDPNARKVGVNLYSLRDEILGDYRRLLIVLAAAVALLVMITLGNLTTLLSVAGTDRVTRLRMQLAIGATRASVVRQLLIEAGLAGAVGGAGAVGLARAGIRAIAVLSPDRLPRDSEIQMSVTIAVLTLAAGVMAGILCALLPSIQAVRLATGGHGGFGARPVTRSRAQRLLQRTFVGAQAAGSLALIVCTVLLLRSYGALAESPSGFTPGRLLLMQLSLPPERYTAAAGVIGLYERLEARLRETPGVASSGCVSLAPLSGLLSTVDYTTPERPAPGADQIPQAHYRVASPGYFAAAGIQILDGRAFSESDRDGTLPVAIVSRTLAQREWPGGRALGHRLRITDGARPDAAERAVVGVVSDVRQYGLDGPATADVYVPLRQVPAGQVRYLVARTYWAVHAIGADPLVLGPTVRRAVREIDPAIAASSLESGSQLLSASLGARRFNLRLLQIFAVCALLLCSLGVYAMVGVAAAQRRRELAVRAACGARASTLVRDLLVPELRSTAIGIAIGLVMALLLGPLLTSLLYGVGPSDSVAIVVAVATVAVTTAVASVRPALRVKRIDVAAELRA